MKATRLARRISQSFCIVLLLSTSGALSAQNQQHRIRNIVLVHGVWADGSGWKGVYGILVKDGYNVSIVQEPETSFKDDVTATKRTLALQSGPCILVAHSYGGAVITEAGTDPSVAGLVYVAAHMPDAGEKESEDGKRFPSDLAKSDALKKTPDGFTYIVASNSARAASVWRRYKPQKSRFQAAEALSPPPLKKEFALLRSLFLPASEEGICNAE